MSARARVTAVLAAARRIADPEDPLGREARARLPDASGLSPEGVELALSEHLETTASDAELTQLLHWAGEAPACHVVLAANVCTAALRALVCAVAASGTVRLRPSRRDPVVAELLVRALDDIALCDRVDAAPGDQVHLYGSDEAVAAIASTLPQGVSVRAHGTGVGIACVEDGLDDAARAIAADLVPFDGRGCLSPRVVLTTGDAHAFGEALHRALVASEVPRGPLSSDDRSALAQACAAFEAIGEIRSGAHHLVAIDDAPVALALMPALRATTVVHASPERAVALLRPLQAHVAALGGEPGALLDGVAALCPAARRSPLGRMQKPPLDGPVDLR